MGCPANDFIFHNSLPPSQESMTWRGESGKGFILVLQQAAFRLTSSENNSSATTNLDPNKHSQAEHLSFLMGYRMPDFDDTHEIVWV